MEWVLGQPVAYYHVARDANCIVDGMARWASEVQATITF